MGEVLCGSQAELRFSIVERLAAAQKSAPLSRRLVGEAAAACGVAESTMWRWIACGGPPARPQSGVVPSDRAVELLLAWRGNVAAVHRQLVEEGEEVPSVRTLARAFERALSPVQRDLARRGDLAVRERTVYLRYEARFRCERYEGDHKQLSIEVLAPRATRPQRPWVTLFVDQFSRLIVGWAMSLRPTQAEVLAALRMAVTIDPDRGQFGGVPVLLRWDRGLEFAADSIAQATLALGCVSRRTDAYCPWQKGKIERLNRTIEQELLQGLPGWTGGPRDVRGRLVDPTPWTLERFVVVFADWVTAYNTARPHTALAGRAPLEVWRSDATPVRALEHREARWMLLARTSHVVQKDGIHHDRGIYFADELSGLRGEEVEVAYMPHDRRWIEVFHEGRWLATARPSVELDASARARVLERRREDEKELKAWARRARRRARVRVAPITGPGKIEPLDPPAPSPDAEPSTGRATLRLLGLEAQLNQPLHEPDDANHAPGAGAMTATHHLGLVGARVVQTAELLLSRRAIRDLLSARALGVMHGPAGSGKTFAAELAVAEFKVERAWVQFPSRPTMLHVARRLYRELTGADPGRANRFELSEELIGLLAGREWLLVVDEAQWLNRECIEYLRHLHDHPRTKFSLLLVGGDGCWQVLSREPMLRSRIYRRVRFAPMRPRTVLNVIPGYHPIYRDAPAELIAMVDDRYAHGCFREWASFTHSALALCHEQNATVLTESVARAVLELHAGGELGEAA